MDELNELIQKAQKGDQEAYGQIYRIFYRRIFRYCQFNTNNKNAAQDICQETFLKAWKALPKFQKKGGSLQAYLFKIARNLIIDASRKKKEERLENYQNVESDVDFEEQLERKQNVANVRNVLKTLDDVEKQIIVLRYFEDLSQREVATVIGIKEGNLRVRTHRILKKLKIKLEEKYE
ncbi:MAG TPA: RNA polymerase sigma factor [Candidatus Saccharimonadales bacterium]|nr:RNA polymerase sigma factor [Candidatus Saccharimonadales bacterium]